MKPHLIGVDDLEVGSAPGDPVPSESVLQVAREQDEKIKVGLGG